MKYIQKACAEPTSLSDWKAQDKMYQRGNATWKRLRTVNGREYKKEFTQALIVEQGYICCYCEQKLDISDSHLEHFIPQNLDEFSEYLFDYNNILCSCQLELESGAPRHCGNSKGSWYDKDLLVSPLDPMCETKFTYTLDGQISHTDEASKLTIKHLQLDIDKLNKLRESAIDSILYLDPVAKDVLLTEDESKEFAQKYLQKNNGRFNEFYTTIEYLFA
ncbi:MAG: retron system putative HNH endonuclease [Arcobacteraceae bacterium]|jgi:uncharacterized protein (TIGR02646 family)|nr:retron system putative HNH endonuclease [Arcobacteraceae bacterium]